MIFTDLRFLFLFACCWLSFFAVPRARRSAALALWGTIFYVVYAGASSVLVVVLVIGAAFSDRKGVAWLAGATVLGLLACFKVAGNAELMARIGASAVSRWAIPLGFST